MRRRSETAIWVLVIVISSALFALLFDQMLFAARSTPPATTPAPLSNENVDKIVGMIVQNEQNITQNSQNLFAVTGLVLSFVGALAVLAAWLVLRTVKFAEEDAKDFREKMASQVKAFKDQMESQTREVMAKSLRDSEYLRNHVLHMGFAESVRIIIGRDNHRAERLRELQQLAQMLNPASIPVFLFVLRSETDPALVTNAAYGLEQLGVLAHTPESLQFLSQDCKSETISIRDACARSLGEIALQQDEVVIDLLKCLAGSDPDPQVRQTAIEALGKIVKRY